jgi:Lrp/AsnC family leucine-responsive transcriptional regulator
MDSIDKKLLILLQKDSKKTTKELSVKLNLSVTAVYERVKKLEREGIIQNYVALINRSKVDKGFIVFCHIKLIIYYEGMYKLNIARANYTYSKFCK